MHEARAITLAMAMRRMRMVAVPALLVWVRALPEEVLDLIAGKWRSGDETAVAIGEVSVLERRVIMD